VNANKQLINLAGILIVVVLLLAGVALIAMPMYSQSLEVDKQTRSTSQNNMLLEQQIAVLAGAAAREAEIDRGLDDLRREIAASPQLNDLHQLIAAAARDVDVHITSVEIQEPEDWTPRGTAADEGAAPATTDETAEAGSESAEASGDAVTADAPAAPPESAAPNRQALATIVVEVDVPFAEDPDAADADSETSDGDAGAEDVGLQPADALAKLAAKAVAFVDALKKGPRLVSPIDLKYEGGELTVTVLTYFRTAGS